MLTALPAVAHSKNVGTAFAASSTSLPSSSMPTTLSESSFTDAAATAGFATTDSAALNMFSSNATTDIPTVENSTKPFHLPRELLLSILEWRTILMKAAAFRHTRYLLRKRLHFPCREFNFRNDRHLFTFKAPDGPGRKRHRWVIDYYRHEMQHSFGGSQTWDELHYLRESEQTWFIGWRATYIEDPNWDEEMPSLEDFSDSDVSDHSMDGASDAESDGSGVVLLSEDHMASAWAF